MRVIVPASLSECVCVASGLPRQDLPLHERRELAVLMASVCELPAVIPVTSEVSGAFAERRAHGNPSAPAHTQHLSKQAALVQWLGGFTRDCVTNQLVLHLEKKTPLCLFKECLEVEL